MLTIVYRFYKFDFAARVASSLYILMSRESYDLCKPSARFPKFSSLFLSGSRKEYNLKKKRD